MPSKTRSKRPDEEDPDVDEEDVPTPASTKNKAAPEKKKKKIAHPDPVDEEAENAEDEEPDEELSAEQLDKQKRLLTKKRKKARLVGYRGLSRAAGYVDPSNKEDSMANGIDCLSSLLSVADAKRLMRFVPVTPGAHGFDAQEFAKRMDLFKHSVPASAARETQARCDAVMRAAMNQVVTRAVESGKKVISPSMMASVLRPYAANMEFTAVAPPLGLVRFAQTSGILNAPEADQNKSADEKKEIAANKKMFNEFMDAEEKRKFAAREARIEARMKRAEAADAAMAEVNAA